MRLNPTVKLIGVTSCLNGHPVLKFVIAQSSLLVSGLKSFATTSTSFRFPDHVHRVFLDATVFHRKENIMIFLGKSRNAAR